MIAMKLRLKTIRIADAHAQQPCSEVTDIQGSVAGVRWLGLRGYPSALWLKLAHSKNQFTTGGTIESV